jgi:hypothetical protein
MVPSLSTSPRLLLMVAPREVSKTDGRISRKKPTITTLPTSPLRFPSRTPQLRRALVCFMGSFCCLSTDKFAAEVNDEDKPMKKAGAGAAGGRKITKVKATKKVTIKKEKGPEKKADDEEAGSDSEGAPPLKSQGNVAKKDAAKRKEKDADDNQNDTGSDPESSPATRRQKPNSPNPRKRKAGEKASIFGPARAEKGKEFENKDNNDSEDGDTEAAAAAEAVLDVEAEDEA